MHVQPARPVHRRSHPTRVRGLKPTKKNWVSPAPRSHPTRVRGLKRSYYEQVFLGRHVAPHAGAWIETMPPSSHTGTLWVAPHAGAWIETSTWPLDWYTTGVAPHAGAWIETRQAVAILAGLYVAPHAGAWIETLSYGMLVKILAGRTPRGCVD